MLRRAVVVCGVCLIVAPLSAQDLVWKWKEGDQFWVRTTTLVNQKMVLEDPRGDVVKSPEQYRAAVGFAAAAVLPRRADNDRDVTAKYAHFVQLQYAVKKVNNDGSAVLTQKLERSEFRNLPKKDEQPVKKEEQLLQGLELTLHCTPTGVVTKVEGQQKLLERLKDGDENREEVLKEMLSEEALKRSATQALGFLPQKATSPGQSWERPADLNLGPLGKLRVLHTYRLDGMDEKRANITTKSTATRYDPGSPALAVQVTGGNLSVAESNGAIHFDLSAGRLADAETKIVIQGSLTLKNGDDVYRTRLTQEQVVKVQVFDKKPSQ